MESFGLIRCFHEPTDNRRAVAIACPCELGVDAWLRAEDFSPHLELVRSHRRKISRVADARWSLWYSQGR